MVDNNGFQDWNDMNDDDDIDELINAAKQHLSSTRFSDKFDFGLDDELDIPQVVYLAGPMRGITRFNVDAFDMAEAMLAAQGFDVFNPAQRDREHGLDHSLCPYGFMPELEAQGFDMEEALTADVSFVINKADAIVLLPGWMMSRGAVAELAVAKAVDIPAYEYDDMTCTIKPLEVGEAKCSSCQGKTAAAPLSMRLVMIADEFFKRTVARVKANIMRKAVKR